jgi:uncharacterized damage-inducible protein DinB
MHRMPDIDADVLIAHLEYASWAVKRTIGFLDKLPPESLTCSVVSSFPSICATLQHLYQWDSYYLTHMRGGRIGVGEAMAPEAYSDLKRDLPELQDAMLRWAQENVPKHKDTILQGWGSWPVWQIIMHVTNHTTHHLGQILTLAREAGYEPAFDDWTDLILFYLQRFPTPQPRA